MLIAETAYYHLEFFNRIITLEGLVWGLYGGFVIGIVLSYYHKVYLGATVRALLDAGADSPESALSLEQLEEKYGVKASRARRRALRSGSALRKVISVANPDECLIPLPPKKRNKVLSLMLPEGDNTEYDFDRMKLYIDKEDSYRAEARYGQKKRVNIIYAILLILLLTALAFIVLKFAIPDLLRMLDNFIGMTSQESQLPRKRLWQKKVKNQRKPAYKISRRPPVQKRLPEKNALFPTSSIFPTRT